MKKLFVLFFFLFLAGCNTGKNCSASVCYVNSVSDLKNVSSGSVDDVHNYKLSADIDLVDVDWIPLDVSYVKFDGAGFNISNITVEGNYESSGLFGSVESSSLKNIRVDNLLLNNNTLLNSYSYSGGIVGKLDNSELINSSAFISLNSSNDSYSNALDKNYSYVGGLVGYSVDSVISNSYSSGFVYGGVSSIDSSESFVGGLIGYSSSSDVSSVFANTNVNCSVYDGVVSSSYCGGLVGYVDESDVSNSYALGDVVSNVYGDGSFSFYSGLLFGFSEFSSVDGVYSSNGVIESFVNDVIVLDYLSVLVIMDEFGVISWDSFLSLSFDLDYWDSSRVLYGVNDVNRDNGVGFYLI